MNRIIKSVILFLGVMSFASCNDSVPDGGQSYPLGLETHHLILKNDATPFEVRIKNTGWRIGGVLMDGVRYENSTCSTDWYYKSIKIEGNTEIREPGEVLCDTMTVEWVELYRIDDGHKLKVKPQPNTTGAKRSLEVILVCPYTSAYVYDTDLKITQQP